MMRVSEVGDPQSESWTRLTARTQRHLLEYICRLLPNLGDPGLLAQDILQETYLAAWGNREEFHGHSEEEFFAWTTRIARFKTWKQLHRAALRAKRERAYQESHLGRAVEGALSREPEPGAALRAKERRAMVQRALGVLPDPARGLVVAVYFQGLTPAEWARGAGVTASTARKCLDRALEKLRYELHEDLL